MIDPAHHESGKIKGLFFSLTNCLFWLVLWQSHTAQIIRAEDTLGSVNYVESNSFFFKHIGINVNC